MTDVATELKTELLESIRHHSGRLARELVTSVSENNRFPTDEVSRAVFALEESGEIEIRPDWTVHVQ